MLDRSAEIFDPFFVAQRRRSYTGAIPLSQLDRLRDMLSNEQGAASYELLFAKEDKQYLITGHISADLALECQVCLEDISFTVDEDVGLGIVTSLDEAERLPDGLEPLVVKDRKIALKDVVEDELLLAVPIIPRHQRCRISTGTDEAAGQRRNRPFAKLAELKSTGDQ